MKIYTKTGDEGNTSLFGGGRVSKDNLRIEAYGTVDELNSIIGICRTLHPHPDVDTVLQWIQHTLFVLGADLATPVNSDAADSRIARISTSDVENLEGRIDAIDTVVAPLTAFILPGGTPCAAMVHMARTVCRRAERLVVSLGNLEEVGAMPTIFLNRLSDALFMIARWENHLKGVSETKWEGGHV